MAEFAGLLRIEKHRTTINMAHARDPPARTGGQVLGRRVIESLFLSSSLAVGVLIATRSVVRRNRTKSCLPSRRNLDRRRILSRSIGASVVRKTGKIVHSKRQSLIFAALIALALVIPATALAEGEATIDTFAGGGAGDGSAATSASLWYPSGVAVASDGSFYTADTYGQRVRKVSPTGQITTVAGDGYRHPAWEDGGYSGDGGPSTSSRLNWPFDVAVDRFDNVYIADSNNSRIRKIDADGVISTVAGNGVPIFAGDGLPATLASIAYPTGISVDDTGNLYIADWGNDRVRKVDATTGIITTLAGRGTGLMKGGSGLERILHEGRPAAIASTWDVWDVDVDSQGNVFFVENGSERLMRIDAQTGNIETVAGGGSVYPGNNIPGTESQLRSPRSVSVAGDGSVFVTDYFGVHRVDQDGVIMLVAGGGATLGDGGPSKDARLYEPFGLDASNGDLYIADTRQHRVRKVDVNHRISTVAGTGNYSYSGDGGQARSAAMLYPTEVASDSLGNVYVADTENHRIRKVDNSGTITTIAGSGSSGFSGDGGLAVDAQLRYPYGLTVSPDGTIFIADYGNTRVRKVDPSGVISTVAGTGQWNFSGDGGPATSATLKGPVSLAVLADGSLLVADYGNDRVRRVDPSGVINTVAGGGSSLGDGGLATSALVRRPRTLAAAADGDVFILDTGNGRVRKVDLEGKISTVAGNGSHCSGGYRNGDRATEVGFCAPEGIAVSPNGTLFISSTHDEQVLRVDEDGLIWVVVGKGQWDWCGDGGPARQACLGNAQGIAFSGSGELYIADTDNNRVRRVTGLTY